MKNRLSELKELILEQFFPVTCPFCGKVISFRLSTCESCEKDLEFLSGVCGRCSKSVCICERLVVLERVFAPFSYDGAVEQAIHRFKFQNHPEYAKVLAGYIVKCFGTNQLTERFDCIVPVPMEKAHRRERGYNQAEELALSLGNLCGLSVLSDALRKIKKTPPQHLLSYEERLDNLKGVFGTGSDSIEGKRVLLCDDVCTTGVTMETCATLLKKNGAASVSGVVVASTQ